MLTSHSSKENYDPTAPASRPRQPLGREPPPVENKLPLYTFGGYNPSEELQTSLSTQDFLPSVSFDDLHKSIASASNEQILDPFSESAREPILSGSMIADRSARGALGMDASDTKTVITGRGGAPITRPVRSGSLLRRQSISTRQSSMSSTASAASGTMDPPSAPLAMRTRRQSQYPPISVNNATKGPRKSIGLGGTDPDVSLRTSQRRRPSLASTTSLSSTTSMQNMSEMTAGSRGLSVSGNFSSDSSRLMTARATKAKSLQPPSRHNQGPSSTPIGTPDHARSSSFTGKSPGRQNGHMSSPSSSARRMSHMPGLPSSNSRASGLGARTVSPTDARRLKRLSTLQGIPPLPHTPPVNQLESAVTARGPSHSPSFAPRKSSTPSSLRTTPDLSRRTYGVSAGSNGGFTPRSSTGSLQPRLSQMPLTSRLPTPKPRNVHSSAGNDDEEVPPVPAIPKAYESPKEPPADASLYNIRKSSLPFDASSINSRNSSSTNELSGTSSGRDPRNVDSTSRARINPAAGASSDADQKAKGAPAKKKHLQPLRLPPLNLLPLSTPTAAKIAAISSEAASHSHGRMTPPPRRANAKTPTTPMTASKASFFSSLHHHDDKSDQTSEQFRSSTSIQHSRVDSGSISPTNPIPAPARSTRQNTVSPFVSSSLPKSSGEYTLMPRSKTSGDFTAESSNDQRQSRVNGPRPHKLVKSPKVEHAPNPSSPDEPPTSSSGSSLRRKLSLGWRRTTSKSSISLLHVANERESEYPPQPPKHDPKQNDMPPPRLPASATMNSLNSHTAPSPTPSVKSTTYLESKRRKSSISSLTIPVAHDRMGSDSWGRTRSPRKEEQTDAASELPKLSAPRSSTSNLTPSHRIIGPKASTSTLRSVDHWTADLDRDDMTAEEEMRRLASRRKETEQAAKVLDALRKRATPKERVSPQNAMQMANLNIYERGEIVDYKDIYFCGTQSAAKHVGQLQTDAANFGYDDERGDYSIVCGDHLSFRYEIIDVLGKGSFGQVVRCIDHKTGGLVAVKIIRNKKRFHQQALVEVNILQKLREWVSIIPYVCLLAMIAHSQNRIQRTDTAW